MVTIHDPQEQTATLLSEPEPLDEFVNSSLLAIGKLWLCDSLDLETKVRISEATAGNIKFAKAIG